MDQIGFEASAPFDTYFVRFADKPYAVTQATGEIGTIEVRPFDPLNLSAHFPRISYLKQEVF